MRHLVVDDDPSLRAALRLVFEDAGHEVVLSATVDEAYAHLEAGVLDVVLIDAGVSERGVAFWRELEASSAFSGKGLLLTGDLPSLGPLRDHPRVFAKPFDYGELLAQLHQMEQASYDQGASTTASLVSTPST
jgi:CheY-like chemotaxis protein